MVRLKQVTPDDYRFLYELLEERPDYANISHHAMPGWDAHVRFCDSQPYEKWYIIEEHSGAACHTIPVGSVYLTKASEIGIFIKRDWQHRAIGEQAVNILMAMEPDRRYLANISPSNPRSMRFFERLGFRHIQNTYESKEP